MVDSVRKEKERLTAVPLVRMRAVKRFLSFQGPIPHDGLAANSCWGPERGSAEATLVRRYPSGGINYGLPLTFQHQRRNIVLEYEARPG